MKIRHCIFIIVLQLVPCLANSQSVVLKSSRHGLDMMLTDVSKDQLIQEIRFKDGTDTAVDVVRFDHVGLNLYPLIISSKLAVPTDSLGLLSFVLKKDTLSRFLEMIDHVNAKVYTREADGVLVRVTYRLDGRLFQYYVTNPIVTSAFLKMIERKLVDNKDDHALQTFYKFIARMKLMKSVNGKRAWKY